MNINNQRYDVTLAANEVRPMAVSGQFFFCVAASVPFSLSIDGGGQITVPAGLAFPTATEFSRLVLQDTSGAGCTLSFYASSSGVQFFPPTTNTFTKDAPTYSVGTVNTALGAGATVVFAGLNAGHARRQIIVTNMDAANNLQILDSAGALAATIFPQRAWTVATSGALSVKNPNGGTISYEVLETFYTT